MQRSVIAGFVVALIAAAVVMAAQAQGISPGDLAILEKSLPPEERARLLEALRSKAPAAKTTPDAETAPVEQPPPEETALDAEEEETPEVPRARGGDTIVVNTRFKDEVGAEEAAELLTDINFARLLGQHAYRLDRQGILQLPGIADVPLSGLTAAEMSIRLAAETRLAPLLIEVSLLPVEPFGVEALQPFGYALFEGEQNVFDLEPAAYAPIPRDYVIGPGDELKVQLYGNENYEVTLTVNQDGTINFPKVGPRPVAGLTFGELKEEIESRVSDQLIGTRAAVTMAAIRSIRIFVVGEVKQPGAYTVSGLSRISNVLFRSGGISSVGSLRRIQLKRNGQLIRELDLYDLLLNGDTANDAQLQSGDVVLVPTIGATVGLLGEIKRPAIYELRQRTTVAEAITLAGGLLPTADPRAIQLERVDTGGRRKVRGLDLPGTDDGAMAVQSGDLIRIPAVPEELDGAVYLSGHVLRPGAYQWRQGITVTDLLPTDVALKPRADLGYVLIRRVHGADRQAEVLSADLAAALQAPKSAADVPLQPRDRVTVFELGISRGAAIQDLLEELGTQATNDRPLQVVKIGGQVRAPGSYPLEPGMRVSDLLRAGGGLSGAAYAVDAELTRYAIGPAGARQTEVIDIDLAAIRAGQPDSDLPLAAYDSVNIKEIPEWETQLEIEIGGEVRFPGVYTARRGETLGVVLQRAGGLTDLAFPQGSIFTRKTLREREKQQLETLATRLESDLARLALSATAASAAQVGGRGPSGDAGAQALGIGQSLLQQLRESEPTGRLVIDLEKIIADTGNTRYDILVRDGDRLLVPPRTQEVTVLGEVQYATSHLYTPAFDRDEYIRRSGGLNVNADSDRVYVVRANGSVMAESEARWFSRGGGEIQPGDTIIAPLDTDRLPQIAQWASITQIIYNLAIAVAAVNSF
jgi:protein involved in polysaccharide export with SLBB domain